MFKPTYLYVKTHNKTGLKYFGKTTAKDPLKYEGSGVKWKKHLKKHGSDISTEIIGYYTDEQECLEFALKFSIENDIVNSDNWANLKEESLDGGFDFINENKLCFGGMHRQKEWSKLGIDRRKWLSENDVEWNKKTIENSRKSLEKATQIRKGKYPNGTFFGKSHTKNTKKKIGEKNAAIQSGKGNSQYGTIWICNLELRENKKIKFNEQIPEGWVKGRKMFK